MQTARRKSREAKWLSGEELDEAMRRASTDVAYRRLLAESDLSAAIWDFNKRPEGWRQRWLDRWRRLREAW